ncbi:hypothetical protein PMAYCL1PPCAC_08821, partial [Pristionchus mayeri]
TSLLTGTVVDSIVRETELIIVERGSSRITTACRHNQAEVVDISAHIQQSAKESHDDSIEDQLETKAIVLQIIGRLIGCRHIERIFDLLRVVEYGRIYRIDS